MTSVMSDLWSPSQPESSLVFDQWKIIRQVCEKCAQIVLMPECLFEVTITSDICTVAFRSRTVW